MRVDSFFPSSLVLIFLSPFFPTPNTGEDDQLRAQLASSSSGWLVALACLRTEVAFDNAKWRLGHDNSQVCSGVLRMHWFKAIFLPS